MINLGATKTPGVYCFLVFKPCDLPGTPSCFHLKKKNCLELPAKRYNTYLHRSEDCSLRTKDRSWFRDILCHQWSSKDPWRICWEEFWCSNLSLIRLSLTLSLPLFLPALNQEFVGRRDEGANGPSLSTLLNLTERCHLSVRLRDDRCESVMQCFPPIITISSCNNNR